MINEEQIENLREIFNRDRLIDSDEALLDLAELVNDESSNLKGDSGLDRNGAPEGE